MKKPNYKLIAALFAICFLSVGIGIAFGSQIATTNYFLDTPLPLYDFYVGQYTNSSYFVVNGSTWDNFLVTTNLSQALNFATGNLTSGGSVFVKKGSSAYSLTPYWLITNDNITIASDGACFILPSASAVAEATTTLVEPYQVENFEMYGFELDGNIANNPTATASHCGNNLYIRNSGKNIYIHDVYSHHARRMGIESLATSGATLQNVLIESCVSTYNGYNDIELLSYDETSRVFGYTVTKCYTGEGTGDISINTYMVDAAHKGNDTMWGLTFSDNTICNMTGTSGSSTNPYSHMGIKIEAGQNVTIQDNMIYNVAIGICDDTLGHGGHTISGNRIFVKPWINATGNIPSYYRQAAISINTDYNIITNNWVHLQNVSTYYNDLQGIRLEATSDCNIVSNNFVKDYGAEFSDVSINSIGFRNLGSGTIMMSASYNFALNCTTAFSP